MRILYTVSGISNHFPGNLRGKSYQIPTMRNHAFYRPGFISCSMSWILWSYRVCMQQGLRTLSCLCGCTFGFRERTHECACMYCTWNLDSAPPEIGMKHSSWQHWEWCVRHSWTWPLCLFISLYVRGHEKFSYSCEGTFVLNQQMGEKWIIMYVRMYLESKPPSPGNEWKFDYTGNTIGLCSVENPLIFLLYLLRVGG